MQPPVRAAETTPRAESEESKEAPDVPEDDIFGFTSPTDPSKVGDKNYTNENDGRVGKRAGRYGALNSRYSLGYTFADDWWIGAPSFRPITDPRT